MSETELSKREQEVLSKLRKGLRNKGIAQSLFISEKTVKSHLQRIFKKLRVRSRHEAIVYKEEDPTKSKGL